jgi:hypothetical protein
VLRHRRLLMRPETIVRWHRDLIAARHIRSSRPKRAGRRPPSDPSACWYCAGPREQLMGYRRIHADYSSSVHKPHRATSNARPLRPVPEPVLPTTITNLAIRRRDRPRRRHPRVSTCYVTCTDDISAPAGLPLTIDRLTVGRNERRLRAARRAFTASAIRSQYDGGARGPRSRTVR